MSELKKSIERSLEVIRKHSDMVPDAAIILGTGLGALVKDIDISAEIPYGDIPNFPLSTVEFHAGKLIFGTLGSKKVVAMQGRFHMYEGYAQQQITFPVRVMKLLGAEKLFISNACGGLNPEFNRGDIMVIKDHINLLGTNPLIGPNDETLGPRFPDMSEPYSRELIKLAESVAKDGNILLRKGVYASMTGPCLETAAEYRMLRIIGADAIGMSTVPEVIVGVQMGFKILGLSVITDMCIPETLQPVDIQEIIKTAGEAEPNLTKLIAGTIEKI